MISRQAFWRGVAGFALLAGILTAVATGTSAVELVAGTPAAGASVCDAIPKMAGTPGAGSGMMNDMSQDHMMGASGPDSSQGHMMETATADPAEIEFDLLFIDMMIPHHESAVAMAQVALERGEHEEIRELARAIIAAQTTEIAQLQAWRDEWYPGAAEMSMDQMNDMMSGMMHGMMDMGDMDGGVMAGMDTARQIMALCNTTEPFDLAFITAMIPHHQSAIMMANVGLENSTHEELKTLQLAIIDAQQGEVDQMNAWRAAWYPAATPTS